ncbi:MAG: hypothetical protein LBE91_13725 [Tannerella sp.]|jgi:hypothetical protein|nr:hypothetical protein [Tannerella sp.]
MNKAHVEQYTADKDKMFFHRKSLFMSIILLKTICILLAACCFPACSQFNRQLTEQERIRIFQEKFAVLPDTSFQIEKHKIMYVRFDDDEDRNEVIILENKKKRWEEIRRDTLNEFSFEPVRSVSIVNLNDKSYLYYEGNIYQGNTGYEADYVLYDYTFYQFYSIAYSFYISKGEFIESDNLSENKELQEFLRVKAYNSSDNEPESDADKYARLFLQDNEAAINQLDSSTGEPVTFNMTKTKAELFDLSDTDLYILRAENEQYIVVSGFRAPAWGYDKATSEYFCIWALESVYDWVDSLQFDDGNLIIQIVNGGFRYRVDLEHFVYTNVKKEENTND